jgi:hypothetical protein
MKFLFFILCISAIGLHPVFVLCLRLLKPHDKEKYPPRKRYHSPREVVQNKNEALSNIPNPTNSRLRQQFHHKNHSVLGHKGPHHQKIQRGHDNTSYLISNIASTSNLITGTVNVNFCGQAVKYTYISSKLLNDSSAIDHQYINENDLNIKTIIPNDILSWNLRHNYDQNISNNSHVMVVGSLTTTLSRLQHVNGGFGRTLDHLLNIKYLHRIYINIPWSYQLRESIQNITLPLELLQKVQQSHGKLVILRCQDYGPSTKLLPTLSLPEDILPSDSIIITFDDDRLYTPLSVFTLIQHSILLPHSVITIAAWSILILSSNGVRGQRNGPVFRSKIPPQVEGMQYRKAGYVDLILGFYGVAYRKRFFTSPTIDCELYNYKAMKEFITHCAWVDDIWFSGHLERLNVSKYVVKPAPKVEIRADVTRLSNMKALSLDKGKTDEQIKQNHDNVLCADAMRKKYGIWKIN